MKLLLVGLFVVLFAFTPGYVLNEFVMPQIQSLHKVYRNADAIAQEVAEGTY